MTATTADALQQSSDHTGLVRKTQLAVAWLAPSSVALPDTLTDATTGAPMSLPTGYWPAGIVNADGYTFTTSVDKSDVDALGYVQPVRSDITNVAKQIQFTTLESFKRELLELDLGIDLSAITQDSANGEIVFDEPTVPLFAEYRLVVIGIDGPASAQWIFGRGYPRVKLADLGDEVWNKADPIQHQRTLDILPDSTLGTPARNYIGGTAAKAASTVLGFTQSV